jgi:hypothetical protein
VQRHSDWSRAHQVHWVRPPRTMVGQALELHLVIRTVFNQVFLGLLRKGLVAVKRHSTRFFSRSTDAQLTGSGDRLERLRRAATE